MLCGGYDRGFSEWWSWPLVMSVCCDGERAGVSVRVAVLGWPGSLIMLI